MKTSLFITCIALSISLNSTFAQLRQAYAPDQIIVKFKAEIAPASNCTSTGFFRIKKLDDLNKMYKLKKIQLIGNKKKRDTYLLFFETSQNIPQLLTRYQKTELFDYVEPNFIGMAAGKTAPKPPFLPNDTYFSRQWGLFNDGSFPLATSIADADIDMELAWDIEQGDPAIIVAVLDSGIKIDHPEFAGRIWNNPNEIADGIDNDNNGYIDDLHGWDFAYNSNQLSDNYGHGTNVAGIIAANGNNNSGYAGVDWNCQLMACKILNDDNFGYYSWWADAIYYAVDHGANLINMSVGGTDYSNTLQAAVDYAHAQNVLIVTSMMNTNSNQISYPAGYQNTIAVGSTDPDDKRSAPFFWDNNSGSNFGQHIDVVAPGNYIYGLHNQSNTNYNTYWGGTSQATPLVTGLGALLLAQDPSRTPDEIRDIIRNTAEDQIGAPNEDTPGFDIYYGYGRINAFEALSQPTTTTKNPEKDPTIFSIYPNPAQNQIFINCNTPYHFISINNLYGQNLLQKENNTEAKAMTLNISSLPKGLYILCLFDPTGKKIGSQKFSVQ